MNFTKYFIAGKDYLLTSYENLCEYTRNNEAVALCDRVKGAGADGIIAFQQNNPKNTQIRGLLSNGQIMRDFSSALICACFDAFLKTDAVNSAITLKNEVISEANCNFSEDKALIFCQFSPPARSFPADTINRRTEIGNRILTVTPIHLSGIHGIHFSQCKNQLNINYLGEHFSRNSLFGKQADFILAQKSDCNTYEFDFYENGTGCPRPTASAFMSVALAAIKTGQQNFNETINIISNGNCAEIICRDEKSFEVICEVRKILGGNT